MTTDPDSVAVAEAPLAESFTPGKRPGLLRWTAFGTGVGVEVREKDLQITAVRVRPSETGVLGAATVTDFRTRPAAEWGAELLTFLRRIGAGHIAATVLLPRRDVIVRTLHLPGVGDRDLDSAIRLQIDSLHPFADEEVCFSWTRLGKTPHILVGIARKQVIDSYSSLFAEAGLKIASITFSAAIIYSALRIITHPPSSFLLANDTEAGVEVYGESEPRPLYSGTLPISHERSVVVARSELRLDPATEALSLAALLPKPSLYPADYDPQSPAFHSNGLSYATALAGACPWLGKDGNLLPAEMRRSSSRLRLIPTFVLAGTLAILLVLLALESSWSDERYLAVLQHEIARYEPLAHRVDSIDRATATARARAQSLDEFRKRSKLDMDALAEITKLIPPPAWLASLDMDRQTVQIAGEAEQAATLLQTLDNSPYFEKSEFSMPITRSTTGEMFRLRTTRQTPSLTRSPGASK